MSLVPADRFRRRYLAAIVFLGLFTILSYAFVYFAQASQDRDASIINKAGLQRALSQQITKKAILLSLVSDQGERGRLSTKLHEKIRQFRESHFELFENYRLSREGKTETLDAYIRLEQIMEQFLSEVDKVQSRQVRELSESDYVELNNRGLEFLSSMNAIVHMLDDEAGYRVKRAMRWQFIGVLLQMLMLTLAALFILEPAFKTIRLQMNANIAISKKLDLQLQVIDRNLCRMDIGMDGEVLDSNTTSQSAFRTTGEILSGAKHSSLNAEPEQFRPNFWHALERGEAQSAEYRYIAPDGGDVWIQATYMPLGVDEKDFYRMYGIDVTQRRKTEQEKLEIANQLRQAARSAGMAEVASGMLHNVGNVLNSVNVSTKLLHEYVQKLPLDTLERTCSVLRENEPQLDKFLLQDRRGKQLPQLLEALLSELNSVRDSQTDELSELAKSVEHIQAILREQKRFTRVSSVAESISATELIEEAWRVVSSSCQGAATLQFDCANAPDVTADRHNLLQILVNLMKNALEAYGDEAGERKVQVTVGQSGKSVQFSIRDWGIGIEKSKLESIFGFGMTTKSFGSGFGLHASANAAKVLGGELKAESDGLGKGANFVLEVPINGSKVPEPEIQV